MIAEAVEEATAEPTAGSRSRRRGGRRADSAGRSRPSRGSRRGAGSGRHRRCSGRRAGRRGSRGRSRGRRGSSGRRSRRRRGCRPRKLPPRKLPSKPSRPRKLPAEDAATRQPTMPTDEARAAEAPAEGADEVAPPTEELAAGRRPKRRPSNWPSPSDRGERTIALAAVAGAHGVKGEVRLKLFSDSVESLSRHEKLYVGGVERRLLSRPRRRQDARSPASRASPTARAAEALRGSLVEIDRSALPPLEEGEYYHADLIGLPAVDRDGQRRRHRRRGRELRRRRPARDRARATASAR